MQRRTDTLMDATKLEDHYARVAERTAATTDTSTSPAIHMSLPGLTRHIPPPRKYSRRDAICFTSVAEFHL